jgi:hypothetical protein
MTRGAIDLARVRRARDALRALAASHPELTDLTTRRRFAEWLTNEGSGDQAMPKPKVADDVRLEVTLGLRLTAEEGTRLDALVARVPIASKHSIARAAFRLGLDILEENPARLVVAAPNVPTMLRKQLHHDQGELEAALDAWPNAPTGWQALAASTLAAIANARVATSAEAGELASRSTRWRKTDLEATIALVKKTIVATLAGRDRA